MFNQTPNYVNAGYSNQPVPSPGGYGAPIQPQMAYPAMIPTVSYNSELFRKSGLEKLMCVRGVYIKRRFYVLGIGSQCELLNIYDICELSPNGIDKGGVIIMAKEMPDCVGCKCRGFTMEFKNKLFDDPEYRDTDETFLKM